MLDGLELLVFRVVARELEFSFQRDAVGEPALDAFLDGVARRVDEIVLEFEGVNITGIRDGKILLEDLEETFVESVVGVGLDLEEVLEGLELNIQEIGIGELADGCKINYSGLILCQGMKI